MASRLNWNVLDGKERFYIRTCAYCTTKRRAFSFIMLEQILHLSEDEIEEAITDGPHDRGIDAVYVDEREGRNVVNLFQFKHVDKFEKANNNFPSNEVDKLLSFCHDVFNASDSLKGTCNPLLWKKIEQIWDAFKNPPLPSFEVHFCGNMEALTVEQKQRLEDSLGELKLFNINYHTLRTIAESFIESKRPKIDTSFQVVDFNYFERTDGNIRGLVATLEAKEIIQLITESPSGQVMGDVFNDNVRVYLTQKNRINRKIHETALSDDNYIFWYLNNGITMTCDQFQCPRIRNPMVSVKNIQIVNGGQTSNALFQAYKEDPDKLQHVLVLVRLYETNSQEIAAAIAEATNSQTPINTRDLRSNDEIQKRLEESFYHEGFYYERKYRQHQDKPPKKRIDALSAGQVFLAYKLGFPEVAKKDRGKVFSDLFYDRIFNENSTTKELLVPIRVYSEIEKRKRDLQKKIRNKQSFDPEMMFLVDGSYHVLYAVYEFCRAQNIDPFDEEKAKAQIPRSLNLLKEFVKEEQRRDEAFTTNRFFKDAQTKDSLRINILFETGEKIKRRKRRKSRNSES